MKMAPCANNFERCARATAGARRAPFHSSRSKTRRHRSKTSTSSHWWNARANDDCERSYPRAGRPALAIGRACARSCRARKSASRSRIIMTDFWLSCGHQLLDRDTAGGLVLTDEFLKLYLARPELLPPPEP